MAGQYRFKDINGNVVAQISASAQGAITFSGSAVDFSNASTITLGGVQLAGTASNALLLDGFDSTAFVFTSSFNTISQSISSQINTLQTTSGSNIGRLNNLESKSSSVDISISNINSVTASNIARLSNLETKSASVDISISNINSFTASNGNTSLNNLTGSLATTGSNTFFGTQTYSGSVYIANDLIVQGSSSIQYISASSVSIGTNIVQLNTANPSVRFAGLTIIDSGSIGGSGSFLYDSVQDEFIFVHRGNGTNVTSSHFVLGPETYDSLGNETYLTNNVLPKGTGKEHLIDSCIFDNGTTTCIKNNLVGTGTMSGTTIYGSTAVCSPIALFSGCVGIGSTSPSALLDICHATSGYASVGLQGYGGACKWYLTSGISGNSIHSFSIGNGNDGTNSKLVITCTGNIGIGTLSPIFSSYAQLTVKSTSAGGIVIQAGATDYSRLFFAKDDTSNVEGLIRYYHCDNSMQFFTNATQVMSITCTGQVAIGATSNLNNFTIKSSSDTITAGGLSFQSRTCVTNYIAMGLNSSNDFEIQTWTTPSWLTRMYIKNDGNIGIGKTPEAISTFRTLDIQGSTGAGVRLSDATNSTNLQQTTGDFYINNISSGTIYFYNGNVERVRITSSGLVIKPYQTFFNVRSSTAQSISTGDNKVIYDTIVCSIGGTFNTALSRFTAPVAGVYAFTLSSSITSGGIHQYHAFFIKINGTSSADVNYRFRGASNSCTGQWFGIIGNAQIPLAASDYVEIFGYTDATTMTLQGQETRWQGYLQG
jgi:hypothetical protein